MKSILFLNYYHGSLFHVLIEESLSKDNKYMFMFSSINFNILDFYI